VVLKNTDGASSEKGSYASAGAGLAAGFVTAFRPAGFYAVSFFFFADYKLRSVSEAGAQQYAQLDLLVRHVSQRRSSGSCCAAAYKSLPNECVRPFRSAASARLGHSRPWSTSHRPPPLASRLLVGGVDGHGSTTPDLG